ncbi:MAG: SurA N-terminal domain-containing protein [Pseudomonadota bacterium]|nr:SurA N-terminal domain-containing protein [Pseudomonadota bacterium]
MRKASQGAIGKLVMTVVMGLIIISFVVWGVGDMLRGFTSSTVAKVGSTKISAQQYQTELQNELYRLQRQLRQNLTPAQARAFGLDAQVLDRLVDQAAVDERARALGLAMSDNAIAEAVRSDPRLKGANGEFDRNKFESYLRDAGLTERGFVAEQRDVYLRQQIQYSLVDGLAAPKALVDALEAARNETREIVYFTLPPAAAGDIPPPSDETLKSYFEAHKAEWRAPEYRSFDALVVTPATLAKPGDVSDDEARQQYDKDKLAKYTVAEKRKLQQIVFANEAEAQEADAKIKAGASFDDIAKARHLADADIDLGEVTKTGAFDPAIADAAFALPQGGVSAPIKGQFGYVLVRVVAITPGSVKPFEEVEPAIKQALAAARASDSVTSLHDKIEDAKASGKSVAEAAKAVGLEAKSYVAVDRQGQSASGAPADVPNKDLLLPAVFASDIGVDDEAIPTKDRGYIWFSVTKIDPAHDRAFDEVKDKVALVWRREETEKRLADAAADLVKKLNAGGDVADLAKGVNAEIITAKDIRRASGGEAQSPEVVAAVFGVGPNQAGSVATPDGRLVFKVTADAFPAPIAGDPALAQAQDRLKAQLSNGVVEQYVDALKHEIGVTIDRRVMQSAEGG